MNEDMCQARQATTGDSTERISDKAPSESPCEAEARSGTETQRECEREDGGSRDSASNEGNRRRGNVARLSKAARDRLNVMMRDGVPYRDIIAALGEDGKDLEPSNLTRWRSGGYQDWLVEQLFLDRVRTRQETPHDLATEYDATEVNHAALQLGALHMFEALRDLGPGSLDKKLGGDSAGFFRLINALARASRETMQLQKYREACARARAALSPMKDPRRKLTDSERRAIVLHVDEILGLRPEGDAFAQMQQDSALTQTAE